MRWMRCIFNDSVTHKRYADLIHCIRILCMTDKQYVLCITDKVISTRKSAVMAWLLIFWWHKNQGISSCHDTACEGWKDPFPPLGKIPTTCAILMLTNDRMCKHIFMFPQTIQCVNGYINSVPLIFQPHKNITYFPKNVLIASRQLFTDYMKCRARGQSCKHWMFGLDHNISLAFLWPWPTQKLPGTQRGCYISSLLSQVPLTPCQARPLGSNTKSVLLPPGMHLKPSLIGIYRWLGSTLW